MCFARERPASSPSTDTRSAASSARFCVQSDSLPDGPTGRTRPTMRRLRSSANYSRSRISTWSSRCRTNWTAGTAEQTCGLRQPVSCCRPDALGNRRRSEAPGSEHRLSDGAAGHRRAALVGGQNLMHHQQFPLAGSITPARVAFSPVVCSQTNFRFRSPTITVNIGSLHKLRAPERSLAQTQPASEPSLAALSAETPRDSRTESSATGLSWPRFHRLQEESKVNTGRGLSYP